MEMGPRISSRSLNNQAMVCVSRAISGLIVWWPWRLSEASGTPPLRPRTPTRSPRREARLDRREADVRGRRRSTARRTRTAIARARVTPAKPKPKTPETQTGGTAGTEAASPAAAGQVRATAVHGPGALGAAGARTGACLDRPRFEDAGPASRRRALAPSRLPAPDLDSHGFRRNTLNRHGDASVTQEPGLPTRAPLPRPDNPAWTRSSHSSAHDTGRSYCDAHKARRQDAARIQADLGGPHLRWGNEHWSANAEYLDAVAAAACRERGPILECGCGLTTLVLATIARRTGSSIYSLEHDSAWRQETLSTLDRSSSGHRLTFG